MTVTILLILLILCLLTCVLETIVLLFLNDRKKWLLPGLLCNVITNPILNMLLPFIYYCVKRYLSFPIDSIVQFLFLIGLEICVIYLETWILGFFLDESFQRRRKISVAMNVFSLLLGSIVSLFLLDPFFDIYRFFR